VLHKGGQCGGIQRDRGSPQISSSPPPHIIRKPRYAVLFQMNSLSSANHVWASGPGQITTALTLTGENRAGDQDGTPQSMARPRASSLLSTIRDTRPILVSKRVSAMRRISRVVGWWVRGWVGGGERETERRRERVSERVSVYEVCVSV
jgi:hypothetical protein